MEYCNYSVAERALLKALKRFIMNKESAEGFCELVKKLDIGFCWRERPSALVLSENCYDELYESTLLQAKFNGCEYWVKYKTIDCVCTLKGIIAEGAHMVSLYRAGILSKSVVEDRLQEIGLDMDTLIELIKNY